MHAGTNFDRSFSTVIDDLAPALMIDCTAKDWLRNLVVLINCTYVIEHRTCQVTGYGHQHRKLGTVPFDTTTGKGLSTGAHRQCFVNLCCTRTHNPWAPHSLGYPPPGTRRRVQIRSPVTIRTQTITMHILRSWSHLPRCRPWYRGRPSGRAPHKHY